MVSFVSCLLLRQDSFMVPIVVLFLFELVYCLFVFRGKPVLCCLLNCWICVLLVFDIGFLCQTFKALTKSVLSMLLSRMHTSILRVCNRVFVGCSRVFPFSSFYTLAVIRLSCLVWVTVCCGRESVCFTTLCALRFVLAFPAFFRRHCAFPPIFVTFLLEVLSGDAFLRFLREKNWKPLPANFPTHSVIAAKFFLNADDFIMFPVLVYTGKCIRRCTVTQHWTQTHVERLAKVTISVFQI